MNQKISQGFSLIEVLVALFVISIGMLGIAAMEIYSSQSGNEAVQRTSAVHYAKEMIERMRANDNSTALSAITGATVGGGTLPIPSTNCKSTVCNATALAGFQLWEWERLLDGANEVSGSNNTGGLDTPRGCITGPAGNSGVYTVTIAWRGSTPLASPAAITCGQGSGLYGANDEFRRVLSVDFYININ